MRDIRLGHIRSVHRNLTGSGMGTDSLRAQVLVTLSRTAPDGKERAHYASGVVREDVMVNLLRSQQLMALNTVIIDVGLSQETTLNNWLCFGCWLYYPDNMIDVASGECLHCARVSPDEGEEDESELLDEMD